MEYKPMENEPQSVKVEVFKTNVTDPYYAAKLIDCIHQAFCDYTANFDLEDCDRVLRIVCRNHPVQSSLLISLLKSHGFHAEVLPGND